MKTMVNVALPKGRLGEKVYAMFAAAGFECPEIRSENRKLIFRNEAAGFSCFWVKPSDVAIYVERGAADIGVAGKDILLEYEPDVYELLDLKTGVCRMKGAIPDSLKIPHIGWNALHLLRQSRLLRYVREGEYVYFVHSYYASGCEDSLIASAEYGAALTAAVEKGSVFGCQFHPEKSGAVGMKILRAFCETEARP